MQKFSYYHRAEEGREEERVSGSLAYLQASFCSSLLCSIIYLPLCLLPAHA